LDEKPPARGWRQLSAWSATKPAQVKGRHLLEATEQGLNQPSRLLGLRKVVSPTGCSLWGDETAASPLATGASSRQPDREGRMAKLPAGPCNHVVNVDDTETVPISDFMHVLRLRPRVNPASSL